MAASSWPNAVSGFAFGSALAISGVAVPQTIRNQFQLTDFHMLTTFLTASATSAIVLAMYDSHNGTSVGTRKYSSYGWFGKFDGNIIGGSMLGIGMALTGACPGTMLVQLALGVPNSLTLAAFTVLSGIVYSGLKRLNTSRASGLEPLQSNTDPGAKPSEDNHKHEGNGIYTIMQTTNLTRGHIVAVYDIVLTFAIAALLTAPIHSSKPTAIGGGLLIGAAQYLSLILSGRTIGVSTAFEDLGNIFWNWLSGSPTKFYTASLLFALGIMAGAKSVSSMVPQLVTRQFFGVEYNDVGSNWFVSGIGAFLLVFGARIGGGCTSGHGISGMSGMSVSSMITTAAIFGAALLTGTMMRS